jgi:hypothetical protein
VKPSQNWPNTIFACWHFPVQDPPEAFPPISFVWGGGGGALAHGWTLWRGDQSLSSPETARHLASFALTGGRECQLDCRCVALAFTAEWKEVKEGEEARKRRTYRVASCGHPEGFVACLHATVPPARVCPTALPRLPQPVASRYTDCAAAAPNSSACACGKLHGSKIYAHLLRVPGYRSRRPGFDSLRYQTF